jgi:HPt (histidine-containing phosphotransfer) domain-containing protein
MFTDDDDDPFADFVIELDGVDVEKAMDMIDGTVGDYLRIITVFHDDATKKLNEIKNCLETNDIQLYTISVHALKSAAGFIGADKLSEDAKALEMAGKGGDLNFIQANNSRFLTDLETLLGNVKNVISAAAGQQEKSSVDKDLLKAELLKLKTAFNAFDTVEINKGAVALREFSQESDIGETVKNILQNKLTGDYDKAVVLIDDLLKVLDG